MELGLGRIFVSGGWRDVPDAHMDGTEAAIAFDHTASAIETQWQMLSRQPGSDEADTKAWLTRTCYAVLVKIRQECEEADRDIFAPRLKKYGRATSRRNSTEFFQLGLRAMFARDEAMSRQYRHELAGRFAAAFRHFVPHVLINGFVGQIGAAAFKRRASNDAIQPDFSDWIIARAAEIDRTELYRDRYCAELERAIEREDRSWED